MKQVLLTMTCAIALAFNSQSQDYYHALGVQYNFATFVSTGSTEGAAVPGLMYKATLGFEGRGSTFAISAYPFAGLQFNTGGNNYFGGELPILAEMYFGDPGDACFFVGAGFSMAYMASDGFGSGAVVGPQVGLGGQFEIAGRLYGVRGAYTYGMNRNTEDFLGATIKVKKNMYSLSLFYPLGQ